MSEGGGRKPGRPRDESARRKIVEAAVALVRGEGLEALTMEGIAARAGVGKQTLYRWWPSRADILLEALRDSAATGVAEPDTGSLHGDLLTFLERTFALLRQGRAIGPLLRALVAEAQSDDALRDRFRDAFIGVRRAALRRLFERAVARGEARATFVADVGVDMVFGAMWYRLLVGHAPIDRAFAVELADYASRAAH